LDHAFHSYLHHRKVFGARNGWEYGLPAFAMTQFVSYSWVRAHQHRWYDTLASSGIAAGYAWAVDRSSGVTISRPRSSRPMTAP
jgi:hypothetical protein